MKTISDEIKELGQTVLVLQGGGALGAYQAGAFQALHEAGVIAELAALLPEDVRQSNRVAEMASYGCLTRMHVVRLLAPALDYEDHAKDIDFSPKSIAQRWQAGYHDTLQTLAKAPWRLPHDPTEGFILHEACGGRIMDQPEAAE